MGLPTSLADAAASIADGTLGLIEIVAIGDLAVSALTGLDGSDEMMITDKPIEEGFDVSDAAIKIPTTRTLNICLANPDFSVEAGIEAALSGSFGGFADTWRDKKEQLYEYYNNRELLSVLTQENLYTDMLISSITPWYDVNQNDDAFFATVVFKKINKVGDPLAGLIDAAESAVGGL